MLMPLKIDQLAFQILSNIKSKKQTNSTLYKTLQKKFLMLNISKTVFPELKLIMFLRQTVMSFKKN